MERLIYRSTSHSHLVAELRHRDLLAEARRRTLARTAWTPREGFRLPFVGLRRLDPDRA